MIVTVALVIVPVVIPGPSEDGTVKLILNVSSCSTISSFVTGIFTILLLVPATIVTICVAELKLFPDRIKMLIKIFTAIQEITACRYNGISLLLANLMHFSE